MAYLHQVLGKTCEDEPGIAHHRQQHLAYCLRLLWAKALCCRPVARQSELAQILQVGGGAGGVRRYQARELLHAQSRILQSRTHEHRVRKLLAAGQGANDLRRFDT